MSDPTSGGAATGSTWAVPDSRPPGADPQPVAPVPGSQVAAPTGTYAGAAAAGRPPPVPVDLRPLTALERVDGGLRVLKLAPATMVAIAACTVVPVQLLASVVPDDPAHPAEPLVVAWLGRGAAITLAEDSARAPAGIVLLALESLALAGAWAVVHAAEAVGALALGVGALVPMVLFAVVTPVLAGEGLGVGAALRRSVALTKRRPGLVLGACLSIALADLALRGALTASATLWADLGLPAQGAVAAAVGIAARMVTVPMVAGAIVLLHLELRVRVEGHDLAVAVGELWPDAPR